VTDDAKDVAEALARTLQVATAALRRAALGPLHRAIVEDRRDAVFTRTDGELIGLARTARATIRRRACSDVNRLWSATQHELGLAAGPPAAAPSSTPADTPGACSDPEGFMSGPRLKLALEHDGASRGRHVRDIVDELKRLYGVRGALIVAPDGFVIAAELPGTMEVDSLAALAATLGRELETSATRMGRPSFSTALFSADDGRCSSPQPHRLHRGARRPRR